MWKKWLPNSSCCSREKSSKSLKTFFFKKKSIQLICTCTDRTYTTVCGIFFKKKWVSRYLTFADYLIPKNCSSTKLLIKLDRQKIKKYRTPFWRQLFHKHLVKFLQDRLNPKELELLECALVITFFNENR